ncbi:hypothetical protein [Sphingomonas sanxanigenens]|uniref:Uncharacterized protein n=1 Tax=Sphingomonas sanxanigenens DSM 19645 = NX02 TaxID=1123269 RepID=W0AJ29_9SPHN|nr:hypothetical protein [Sphingomonas sanxanigenens]AHE57131.1 hypothetical protein NX02_27740 [Sphingomonas sanxanigenens DSM 19645 = NX02]
MTVEFAPATASPVVVPAAVPAAPAAAPAAELTPTAVAVAK